MLYCPARQYRHQSAKAFKEAISPFLFKLSQSYWRLLLGRSICTWANGISIDGKFTSFLSSSSFCDHFSGFEGKDVLLPGCHFNSREARDWLKTSCQSVTLLDIVDWSESFMRALPMIGNDYSPSVSFGFGTVEDLPFDCLSFDIIESRAVLEHVGNIEVAANEMYRVLRPGGLCVHSIGPLYFSPGGDHCISACGLAHAFDHLLLSENEYQSKLRDEQHFSSLGKDASDARFWAINGIFSYLTASDYLRFFQAAGFVRLAAWAIISKEALVFRRRFPMAWQQLLCNGVAEEDLLVSGLILVLVKS